jgi:hypothetical protein
MNTVQEFNEFTWDMVRGLPRAYHEKINNGAVKVRCKENLSNIYYFADEVEEVSVLNPYNDTATYTKDGPEWINRGWTPPPLKKYYREISKNVFNDLGIEFSKPTVVIQNKYSREWEDKPRNFISIKGLDNIISILKDKYDIIYIRPKQDLKNYYFDDNTIYDLGDYEMIKNKHPEVVCAVDYNYNYNKLQFCLCSTSEKHIAVSGGNACISAYFEGSVIILDKYCLYGKRPIWSTDSWLKKLSGSKIIGTETEKDLIINIKTLWV